jgi:hopanoid C-2 methylase
VFCGIETPDPAALHAMGKQHNTMVPILEAIGTLNRFGMEVVSGIILGLDTDTLDAGPALLEFIERSHIPMLTINLLQALPRTPLWDRLEREGRLLEDGSRESNVDFRLPYDQVLAMWRDCMAGAYQPKAIFARYAYQVRETYPHRPKLPNSSERVSWRNVRRGLDILRRIIWEVGVRADYRREFWRFALPRLVRGDIERVIAVGLVAHHLIVFAREAVAGRRNASHYSAKLQEAAIAAE